MTKKIKKSKKIYNKKSKSKNKRVVKLYFGGNGNDSTNNDMLTANERLEKYEEDYTRLKQNYDKMGKVIEYLNKKANNQEYNANQLTSLRNIENAHNRHYERLQRMSKDINKMVELENHIHKLHQNINDDNNNNDTDTYIGKKKEELNKLKLTYLTISETLKDPNVQVIVGSTEEVIKQMAEEFGESLVNTFDDYAEAIPVVGEFIILDRAIRDNMEIYKNVSDSIDGISKNLDVISKASENAAKIVTTANDPKKLDKLLNEKLAEGLHDTVTNGVRNRLAYGVHQTTNNNNNNNNNNNATTGGAMHRIGGSIHNFLESSKLSNNL